MTPSNAEAMAFNYRSSRLSTFSSNSNHADQSPYTGPKSQDSIAVPRRRPGRPRNVEMTARNEKADQSAKRLTKRMLTTIKRQVHNDSAMRSRLRFNTILDDLWEEVPEWERSQALAKGDPSRCLCRAERIEIVTLYLRELRKTAENERMQ